MTHCFCRQFAHVTHDPMKSHELDLYSAENPVQYLSLLFRRRKRSNSRYSLRAYAASIQLAPSIVSDVFRNKKRLSSDRLRKIAPLLRVTRHERSHYLHLVDLAHATDPSLQVAFRERIQKNQMRASTLHVPTDRLTDVIFWDAFFVNECLSAHPDGLSLEQISKWTGLSTTRVADIIPGLLRLSIVEKSQENGSPIYRRSAGQVLAESETDHSQFKAIHREGLSRAHRALHSVPASRRYSVTEMITIHESLLPAFRRKIDDTLDQLQALGTRSVPPKDVYAIALHVFPVRDGV